jgi:hypothetical protein
MVRIGFLARVRGFTYRDDLYNYIINSPEWKASPFHLRLYFDSFSTNTEHIATYAAAALSNLHSPAQKRLAIDLEAEHPESGTTSLEDPSLTSTIPIPAPAVTPNQRPPHSTHPIQFTTTTTTTSTPSSLSLDSLLQHAPNQHKRF